VNGRLEGKVAIVTGGGRGIGESIARRFARDGAKVVLAQRTEEEGQRVATAIADEGGEAISLSTDVTNEDSVAAMVDKTLSTYGRLDILCNNAGIGVIEDITDVSMENYDAVMNVNVRGVLLGMKHAARPMIEAGRGNIINIASFNAFVGLRHFGVYCASKAAVVNLTRQVALDLGRHGIRVNAIAPGYIDNPMANGYFNAHKDAQALKSEALKSIPLGRFGTNDEVAGAASYLASDDAGFVTGTTLVVDGGTLCHGPHAD
jgi:meso-butanediol dehydrogenase/(S,S)-butanediol dehydrogenase/diacetyl reductase